MNRRYLTVELWPQSRTSSKVKLYSGEDPNAAQKAYDEATRPKGKRGNWRAVLCDGELDKHGIFIVALIGGTTSRSV